MPGPRAYPVPQPDPDHRFASLVMDVTEVLVLRGYPQPTTLDVAALAETLRPFVYGPTETTEA